MRLRTLLALVVFSASCGGLPGFKKKEPLTQEEGAARYAEGICGTFARCFADNALQALVGTEADCAASFKGLVMAQFSLQGASATGDQLGACGDAYADMSCADLFQGPSPSACILPGTLAAGTACSASSQCTTRYCKYGTGATCGTCALTVAAGGNCSSDNDCDDNLVCHGGICSARRIIALNAACDTSDAAQDCVYGTYCKTGTLSSTGTCVAYAAAGASCTDAECSAFQGQACNASNLCASYGVSPAGGQCAGSTFKVCHGGGRCVGGTSVTQGSCEATAAAGATCSDTSGPVCTYPADCNRNGVCSYVRTCQ